MLSTKGLSIPSSSFAAGILVDCDKSPGFQKRLDASVKKLEGRLAKYEVGTPPYLALQSQIQQTKTRFKSYADSQLLCGADGLPHLIVDGDFKHAGEFMIPGCLFLYTAGWIGWAGRKYLNTVATSSNPTEKEIIIDVPLALKIMLSGYLWPVVSWQEFVAGDFIESPEEITVSPR
jgi:photosystem I subunit 3